MGFEGPAACSIGASPLPTCVWDTWNSVLTEVVSFLKKLRSVPRSGGNGGFLIVVVGGAILKLFSAVLYIYHSSSRMSSNSRSMLGEKEHDLR